MDIYKCPKSIFREWSWVKKLDVLYILTILVLKDHFSKASLNKSGAKPILWQITFCAYPKVENKIEVYIIDL
jgi:hypothetical protein